MSNFCVSYLYAQEFQFNKNKPLEITADSLIVSDDTKTGEFIGNVQVIQDQYKLTAHRIIIEYSDKKEQNNVVKIITAHGNVYLFNNQEQAAHAGKMRYNLDTKMLHLSQNVLLSYNKSTLKGNEMIVNTQTKHIQVKGSRSNRVKAIVKLPQ